ncbi:MAG: hypothetical protein ABGX17_04210, partial [Desulfurobacteriaceae bacterium]
MARARKVRVNKENEKELPKEEVLQETESNEEREGETQSPPSPQKPTPQKRSLTNDLLGAKGEVASEYLKNLKERVLTGDIEVSDKLKGFVALLEELVDL